MIASKFGIGQQVRHSLLGYLGVVVDIDPVYSLSEPSPDVNGFTVSRTGVGVSLTFCVVVHRRQRIRTPTVIHAAAFRQS